MEKNEERLLAWLRCDRDIQEKSLAFRKAQEITFGKIPDNIDRLVNKWLGTLSNLKSIEDIVKNWEEDTLKRQKKWHNPI